MLIDFCKRLWDNTTWGIHSDRGLFEHRWFLVFIFLPIIAAVVMAWLAGLFYLELDLWSMEGYKYFYSEGKFFLAVAALSIPLGATFSRIHSSHQTAESIKQALEASKRDQREALKSDFFSMLEYYQGYEIPFEKDVIKFDKKIIKAPLLLYNKIFLASQEHKIKDIKVLINAKELIVTLEEFCSIENNGNFVDYCNSRSEKLTLASLQASTLAKTCGVQAPFQPIRAAHEKHILTSHFPPTDTENPSGSAAQEQGASKLSCNLINLGLAFFYASHIVSGRDENLNRLLTLTYRYLLSFGHSLSSGVRHLDHDEINEKVESQEKLDPFDRGLLAFWGGRFIGIESNTPSSYRNMVVSHMKDYNLL